MTKRTPAEVRAQIRLCEWLLKQEHVREAVQTALSKLVAYQFSTIKHNTGEANEYDDPGFVSFWKAYPRKVGKGAAWKAWNKIRPSQHMANTIVHSVRAHTYTEEWRKDDGRFIPNPATYLNQARYDDEVSSRENLARPVEYEIDEATRQVRIKQQTI